MSWHLPTLRVWSYAFTFASGGLVATLLLQSRSHTSALDAPKDRTRKLVSKHKVPQDSVDARSGMDPSEDEKIHGGVEFLKKMFADKYSDGNDEQKLSVEHLQHEHVSRFPDWFPTGRFRAEPELIVTAMKRDDDQRHVLITTQNPDGKSIKVRAFLDTGCDGNLISQSAVDRFGLEPTQGEEYSWVTGSGAKVRSQHEVVLPYVATHINDKTIRVPFAVLDTLPDDVEDIILGNKFLVQAHYITFNSALADIVDPNYSNKPSSPTLMQMRGGPPSPPGLGGYGQHSQARRSNGMWSCHHCRSHRVH